MYGLCFLAALTTAYGDALLEAVGQQVVLKEIHSEVVGTDSLALLQQTSVQIDADARVTPDVQSMDYEAEFLPSVRDKDIVAGATFSESCKMAIEHKMTDVDTIMPSFVHMNETEMAFAVEQLLRPAQRALMSWTKGLRSAADFELIEFSLLLTQQGFREMFLCDTSSLSPRLTTHLASSLSTVVEALDRECPQMIFSDTMDAMNVVLTTIMDGLRCHKAGLNPKNTSRERATAFETATIKGDIGVDDSFQFVTAKDSASSFAEARLALTLGQLVSFAFSMPHRKLYLEEARPGIVSLMEEYLVGKNFTSTAGILLADKKLKSRFQPDEAASSDEVASLSSEEDFHKGSTGHRRRGQCYHGHRRRGQATYNFDQHPFRAGSRRGTLLREKYRNTYCPKDSEKDLDDLFETDCTYKGRTSPAPLLYFDVISPTCAIHDVCYACGRGVVSEVDCDAAFYENIINECRRKKFGSSLWQRPICMVQANIVWAAVRTGGSFNEEPPGTWCKATCAKTLAFSKHSEPHMKILDDWYPE